MTKKKKERENLLLRLTCCFKLHCQLNWFFALWCSLSSFKWGLLHTFRVITLHIYVNWLWKMPRAFAVKYLVSSVPPLIAGRLKSVPPHSQTCRQCWLLPAAFVGPGVFLIFPALASPFDLPPPAWIKSLCRPERACSLFQMPTRLTDWEMSYWTLRCGSYSFRKVPLCRVWPDLERRHRNSLFSFSATLVAFVLLEEGYVFFLLLFL